MTSRRTAPPLPEPPTPAVAARAFSQAARAAASAWAQPMDPAGHHRGVCQLYSVLRDLSVATRGLARYQIAGESRPAAQGFRQQVRALSLALLEASDNLDGVLAAKGPDPLPDDSDPGAALCQATREAIRAWRQPTGTRACRDAVIEQLLTALGTLMQATRSLAERSQPVMVSQLRAVHDHLGNAIFRLAGALEVQTDIPPNDPNS
jgi:hypothetical protein